MATISVKSLLPYISLGYPQLTDAINVWLSKELRKIQTAITSMQQVTQAGITGVTPISGLPTTSNLPAGSGGLFKDTSGGGVYLAYNDAGVIKKVALV